MDGALVDTQMFKSNNESDKNLRIVFTLVLETYLIWNKYLPIYRGVWSNPKQFRIKILVDNIYSDHSQLSWDQDYYK